MSQHTREKSAITKIGLIILPYITYLAYQHMVTPLISALAEAKTSDTSSQAAGWNFTGYNRLDNALSPLVKFFIGSFDNGRFAAMQEFFPSVGPAIVVPIIEMRRSGYRSLTVFVFMVALGAVYQNLGAGLIIPLWWALYLLLNGDQTVPLYARYADATLAGYAIGFVGISGIMIAYQTPNIVAAWQFFPALIMVVQALFLLAPLLPAEGVLGSSYNTIQAIHSLNFTWSILSHAYTLSRVFNSPDPLDSWKDSYVPTYASSSVEPLHAVFQQFLKWDVLFIAAPTLFTGLWLLHDVRSRLIALGWFVVGSLFFGVGAGLSGVWVMREKQVYDNHFRLKQKKH